MFSMYWLTGAQIVHSGFICSRWCSFPFCRCCRQKRPQIADSYSITWLLGKKKGLDFNVFTFCEKH